MTTLVLIVILLLIIIIILYTNTKDKDTSHDDDELNAFRRKILDYIDVKMIHYDIKDSETQTQTQTQNDDISDNPNECCNNNNNIINVCHMCKTVKCKCKNKLPPHEGLFEITGITTSDVNTTILKNKSNSHVSIPLRPGRVYYISIDLVAISVNSLKSHITTYEWGIKTDNDNNVISLSLTNARFLSKESMNWKVDLIPIKGAVNMVVSGDFTTIKWLARVNSLFIS